MPGPVFRTFYIRQQPPKNSPSQDKGHPIGCIVVEDPDLVTGKYMYAGLAHWHQWKWDEEAEEYIPMDPFDKKRMREIASGRLQRAIVRREAGNKVLKLVKENVVKDGKIDRSNLLYEILASAAEMASEEDRSGYHGLPRRSVNAINDELDSKEE